MRYKAILCDVDRTLIVAEDALPTPAVTRALRRLQDQVHVGLASSRPLTELRHIFDYLELSGPSIVSNGAQIVDVKTGNYVRESILPSDIIDKIHRIVQAFGHPSDYWVQDDGTDYQLDDSYIPNKPLVIVAHDVTHDTANCLIDQVSDLDVFAIKAPTYTKGFVDVHITNQSASKGDSVKHVASYLGISTAEIIGAGDGYNDLPLLKACGLRVAMGNAVPELKRVADFVAPSVEDDGLAVMIAKFFPAAQ
jgi:HAD superfamily hydrolase (TIGR01484 family)